MINYIFQACTDKCEACKRSSIFVYKTYREPGGNDLIYKQSQQFCKNTSIFKSTCVAIISKLFKRMFNKKYSDADIHRLCYWGKQCE